MQVLVKNPFAIALPAKNVIPSFWSDECLYMEPTFSMTSLMELTDPLGLSPFLVVDARVGFCLYMLKKGRALYTRNAGALGALGAHIVSESAITHNEDPKKFDQYAKEYLPHAVETPKGLYDQILCFNSKTIDPILWNKLEVGGFYILATIEGSLTIKPPGKFEAFGKLWPKGMSTEFGWKFNEENIGLNGLEVAKIKKLS
jgi:hypothetical protein